MRLVMVRHGETTWNAEHRLQGHDNAPLSLRGIKQVQSFASFAKAMAPDRVVVSDLGRTRQTASLLGYGDAPLDPRLREIDMGNWTGRIKHELEAERPHEYLAWRAGTFTPDRGEPWAEFCARIVEGLRDCLRTCSGDTLAIVHGGVIRAACHAFLGLPPSRVVPVTPGTATILSFDAADAPTARLEAYNIAAVTPDFDAPD
ncbi:histidine phosphatase family protein [Aminobacter aminovorans]|uniref:histidine phosphatase family protein n=1 Tax=Aminobacter TaxID=31988 RepID=UPI002866FBF8|nr:histidine phosphatase family protein [Aminobacter aminovorans]MDR7221789.1 putative phosphoglycerate mutase [Aminobacter aminovorans]